MTPEENFVQRVTASIEDLALLYVGHPDEKIEASLHRFRGKLKARFVSAFPDVDPDGVAAGVEYIISSIEKRRREMERGARFTNS
jgi:hypothetical protein